MKKILVIVSVMYFILFNYGINEGSQTGQAAHMWRGKTTRTSGQTGQQSPAAVSCPPCAQSDETTATAMPAITVVLQDINGNPLNSTSYTFANTSFSYNNALLTVHIFPPSNGVGSTSDSTYYVVYTLKSLDGITLQKQILPTLAFNTFPGSVVVSSSESTPVTSTFLPKNAPQQLFNAICPQSQKFIITQNSGTVTAVTSLSGVFETSNDTITIASASATIGGGTQPITVQINSQPSITFPVSSFNSADLKKGLSLTVNIFPPSTSNSSGSYFIVATLKTLDGLKLQKQVLPSASIAFTHLPSSITISYGTTTLTSSFFSTGISSTAQTATPAFNLVSPISLKYLLQTSAISML